MLPDKAIDLMDEAASRLRMEIDSVPAEVDDLQRQLNQLEMEKLALEKETDKSAVARRETIDRQIAELRDELDQVKARWEQEKEAIDDIRALQKKQENLALEMETAERQGDLARASELKYSGQAELERRDRGRPRGAAAHPGRQPAADAKRSTRTTSPSWWPSGPASPPSAWSRTRWPSCASWKNGSPRGWWARTRPSPRWRAPSAAPAPGLTDREPAPGLVPLPGPDRAWARPSWPRP